MGKAAGGQFVSDVYEWHEFNSASAKYLMGI